MIMDGHLSGKASLKEPPVADPPIGTVICSAVVEGNMRTNLSHSRSRFHPHGFGRTLCAVGLMFVVAASGAVANETEKPQGAPKPEKTASAPEKKAADKPADNSAAVVPEPTAPQPVATASLFVDTQPAIHDSPTVRQTVSVGATS